MKSNEYLSGAHLIGEDFTPEEEQQWFADEQIAYTKLRGPRPDYEYHLLNTFHAYRFIIGSRALTKVLSVGGYDGAELIPLIDDIGNVTILEPSGVVKMVIPASHVQPEANGIFPFKDRQFALITCLNTLHHIPKVCRTVSEISRCLAPGGFAVFTEPIVSMGDWRQPRPGLTKHERGIPLTILRDFITASGLVIIHQRKHGFAPLLRIAQMLKRNLYSTMPMIFLDWILSSLPFWPTQYHAATQLQKIRPGAVFIVAVKPMA